MRTSAFCLVVALGLVGQWVPIAKADLINFDDFPVSGGNLKVIPNGYHGLAWSDFEVLNAKEAFAPPNGYIKGMVSPNNVAYNGGGLPASLSDGIFAFNSAYFTAAWRNGLTISIIGKLGGVTVDSTSFDVNTSGPTFKTFNWV